MDASPLDIPDRAPLRPKLELVLPFRHVPRPSSDFAVLRKDLLRLLTEASMLKQLSMVRGPAGSGKTMFLAQWRELCRQMQRPLAWLTIDSADREPAHFVAGLASALENAGCDFLCDGFRAQADEARSLSAVQVAQRLASVFNQGQDQPVVVLDQYEAMDGPAANEILNGLLEQTATLKLVIASRTRPGLALGRLRARDQLFEIGPSDLNFTLQETRAVFSEEVPELYARRLHLETSGEPVAIGFARRAMDEVSHDMLGPANWQEGLHEYYRDEMLGALPDPLRAAMGRLVVVEAFDVSLATALIGAGAMEAIERLHHFDGLLLKQKGTREYYFSEMLRRFLATRLVQLDEVERRALHSRASDWFAARGQDLEALRHAIAAGDTARGRALLGRVGSVGLVAQHGVSGAHNLIDALRSETEAPSAATLLSLALIHAHERDVPSATDLLEQARGRIGGEALDPETEAHLALATAYVAGLSDRTLEAETAPNLRAALARLPAEEHDTRAQIYVLLSWDRFCRGDVAEALTLTDEAAREYAETESVFGAIFMHIHRALALFWLNDLSPASDEIATAERMARIFFPEDRRVRLMTGVIRAGLLSEMDRPDTLVDFTTAVGAVAAVESWSEIQIWAHVYGARAAAERGRNGEASVILSNGLQVAERLDLPRLAWSVRLEAIETALAAGDLAQASRLAAELGLPGAAFLERADPRLLWKERIAGVLTALRLAEAAGELDDAQRLGELAGRMVAETSARRFAMEVEIALSRVAERRGDLAAAREHIQAAVAVCPAGIPMRLLRAPIGAPLPLAAKIVPVSAAAASARTDPKRAPGVASLPGADRDPLTARERQILLFMGEGYPSKIAAHRLQLSEATVKFHLRNAYRKLHAQNRIQALARYRQLSDL